MRSTDATDRPTGGRGADAGGGSLRVLALGTLYPPFALGGYERNWRDLVGRLRGRGHRVRVLCSNWQEVDNGQPEDPDVSRELELWVDDLFDPRRDPAAVVVARERHNDAILARELDRFEPDVALIGPVGGLSLGLLARLRQRGVPQLAQLEDDWPAYAPGADAWQRRLRRSGPLAGRLLRRHQLPPRFRHDDIDDWSIISERTRRVAVGAGVDPARTAVIPIGPDDQQFTPSEPSPWRGELLYSGRLHPNKGVEHTLRALAELPDCRLTIKGSGDPRYLAKLERIATEVDVAGRVHFAGGGGFEELPALYRAADAVLFPSVWEEPWGLVPLEAMAIGRPVVACAVGGAAEYLRHEVNALVVPRSDPIAIAAAVRRLGADADLRARLREGGAATARQYRYADFLDAVTDRVEALAARASPKLAAQ